VKKVDYYDLLEVSPRASREVIEAAYRALMKQFHPDKFGGKVAWQDKAVAEQLNEARDVLLDPNARAKYDQERNNLQGTIVGDFRVLEKIAEGGFGKTYKGEHILTGAPVCIKHCEDVSPQHSKILIEEALSIWDLSHFGIPIIRNLIKLEDGSLALVMSYVPGPTIAQIIEKVGRLDPENACWISDRVLQVLQYLHYRGVVHGDIKPQNIIVQPKEHKVVVIDYGLAAIKPTYSSMGKGLTEYFAPPEMITAWRRKEPLPPLIPQSDFFSLGMTMIYMLGGDVKNRLVPDKIPDLLCSFIKSLIAREPLDRPSWETVDVREELRKVRIKAFGREHSDMKPIPGF
jgi:serine/threonine protein kinase